MSLRAWLPADTTAISLGADPVADALEHNHPVQLTRTGSRGLAWLEPLLEVETPEGRLAFGPLAPEEVVNLVTDGQWNRQHPKYLGALNELPALQAQQRLTCANLGEADPLSLQDYRARGGFEGLTAARQMGPDRVIAEVTDSGLRGRGGAAFPAGIKWRTTADTAADQRYIVCNADEGDSGTFVDRLLMEGDPFGLVEGMAIAALAVGADRGFIYCRAEYPLAIERLQRAIETATEAGEIDGFHLEVREAAGAYICGEETSMLESLEGRRGLVRFRPPLPAIAGLFGKPTVVNNVTTLASVPWILRHGGAEYASFGAGRSTGTLTVQLAGNIARGGLYEVPFGISLRTVIEELGGGTASGRPLKAVQAGGPLGAYIPASQLDTPLDYESFKTIGAMLGHGGLVVFDDTADLGQMARFAMAFCAEESCGKCTPCRVGAVRGVEVIDRILASDAPDENRLLLQDLCHTMIDGSLCALGGMAPSPVLSIMQHFPEELGATS